MFAAASSGKGTTETTDTGEDFVTKHTHDSGFVDSPEASTRMAPSTSLTLCVIFDLSLLFAAIVSPAILWSAKGFSSPDIAAASAAASE